MGSLDVLTWIELLGICLCVCIATHLKKLFLLGEDAPLGSALVHMHIHVYTGIFERLVTSVFFKVS